MGGDELGGVARVEVGELGGGLDDQDGHVSATRQLGSRKLHYEGGSR